MADYKNEIRQLVEAACLIVGKPLVSSQMEVVYQSLNHKPLILPPGKMAVYTFVYNRSQFLKIGKAGPNSAPRYKSHHYYENSGPSTLAKSLVNDSSMPMVTASNVTDWIRQNCERYDVIIDASLGKMLLDYIEGMLHYKYLPKYEG